MWDCAFHNMANYNGKTNKQTNLLGKTILLLKK